MDGGFLTMHKLISPESWVKKICKNDAIQYESIHFDHFKNYEHGEKTGIELLLYSCDILTKLHDICIKKKIKPMISFSLGCTKNLQTWDDSKWNELGKNNQPPNLCLENADRNKGYGMIFEYYRCPIQLPFDVKNDLVALFQSSRDEKSQTNNWEYWESILLYYKKDF